MKRECLPIFHKHRCTEKLREILHNPRESLEEAVYHSDIGHIERNLSLLQSLDVLHAVGKSS